VPSQPVDAPDKVFSALADPTRRQVLRLVAERGPASATALERELPVSRQAIVKHLVVLKAAGLVSGERQGQEVRYGLVSEPLGDAAAWQAIGALTSASSVGATTRLPRALSPQAAVTRGIGASLARIRGNHTSMRETMGRCVTGRIAGGVRQAKLLAPGASSLDPEAAGSAVT
jgi:DNA-binding transcriptional ArsR family regulator